jgi:hypothetical protein
VWQVYNLTDLDFSFFNQAVFSEHKAGPSLVGRLIGRFGFCMENG